MESEAKESEEEIREGVGDWVLESYYWRETDGVGIFFYYNLKTRQNSRVKRIQRNCWTPATMRNRDDDESDN